MRYVPARLNLIDDMFKDSFYRRNTLTMKTNITEKDGDYLLDIELPGFTKEDIKVELERGYLNISAAKNESSEEKDEKGTLIRQERFSGSCSRSYYIGEEYTDEDIAAKYENGILQVSFKAKSPEEITNKKSIIIT